MIIWVFLTNRNNINDNVVKSRFHPGKIRHSWTELLILLPFEIYKKILKTISQENRILHSTNCYDSFSY